VVETRLGPSYDHRMAKVGAVARREEDYGVVIAVSDTDFDAIQIEWADGRIEWLTVSEVEWVDSGE